MSARPIIKLTTGLTDVIARIDEWHFQYCDILNRFHQERGGGPRVIEPRYWLKLRGTRQAGAYYPREHRIMYSVPYALMSPTSQLEETVAHECVHAYQRAIMPECKYHDGFFLFLIRNVCGFRQAGFYHRENTRVAKALGDLLMMQLPCDKASGEYTGAMPHIVQHADAACKAWSERIKQGGERC